MNDSIIRKVRALLARADAERNDNEHERAIALRQATALMDKHNIAATDLDAEADPRGKSDVVTGQRLWRSMVIDAIGRLYGCKVYRSTGAYGRTFVIGRESHRTTTLAISDFVIASVEREAKRYAGGVRYTNAFKKGAAAAVHQQVRELTAARKRGETTSEGSASSAGTALAVVAHYRQELAANEAYLRDDGTRLSSCSRSRISDGEGYAAGRAYGAGLSLNGQIGGAGQRQIGN